MSDGAGSKTVLNITVATVVDATTTASYATRRINRVNVVVAGSAPGSVNDAATVAAVSSPANQVFVIPNVAGTYWLDTPCINGIVVTPGTGQTVAVIYGA